MYRINEEGLCIILMYVDDNLIVGSRRAIDKATKEIQAIFSLTVSPIATEYLGCEIDVAENYLCRWIGQPDLYKNLEVKFGNMIKVQRATETPSTPGFHVVRNRGCQSWMIFYLSSNFFFEYYALAKNFRLSKPKKPNFDYPQMHNNKKISSNYLILHAYANEPFYIRKNPFNA